MNSVCFGVGLVVVVLVAGAAALGYPYDDEYSTWRLARSSRRSHHCVGSGSKCFSTQQCCTGFVCAAFDDYFGSQQKAEGMNPEVPGFCVKEKDLQRCYSNRDCSSSSRCIPLGRDEESYCISRSAMAEVEREQENEIGGPKVAYHTSNQRGNGGYGASCTVTSDCKAFDKSGNELCCQKITRGRQGKKLLCDRVNELSKCL